MARKPKILPAKAVRSVTPEKDIKSLLKGAKLAASQAGEINGSFREKIAYAADHEEALRVRGRAFYVVSAPVYAAMRVAWLKLSAAAQALKREDAEAIGKIANYADRMVRKDLDRFTANQPGPGDQTTWGSPLKPGA